MSGRPWETHEHMQACGPARPRDHLVAAASVGRRLELLSSSGLLAGWMEFWMDWKHLVGVQDAIWVEQLLDVSHHVHSLWRLGVPVWHAIL